MLVGQMRAGARLMQDTGDLSPDAVEVLELFTMLARVRAVFGMDLAYRLKLTWQVLPWA